jgi:hypothetical protein
MTPDRFNEIVKNRANQRVNEKVAKFKSDVAAAFKNLHPCLAPNDGNQWFGGAAAKHVIPIMRQLLGLKEEPGRPIGYPKELWSDEEDKVQKELLATMDEMAKALLAPPAEESLPVVNHDPNPSSKI